MIGGKLKKGDNSKVKVSDGMRRKNNGKKKKNKRNKIGCKKKINMKQIKQTK